MQAVVSVRLVSGGRWLSALLTDERAESSYGLPVVILQEEESARGPGEVYDVRLPADCPPKIIGRASAAGFRLLITNQADEKGAKNV